jgi:hypothetical protein
VGHGVASVRGDADARWDADSGLRSWDVVQDNVCMGAVLVRPALQI